VAWIRTFAPEEASGRLAEVYRRIAGPHGEVDNILRLHGLRPHTLEGHMALYKSVLHHTGNALPEWLLEAIGVYVSLINACEYCVDHHVAGMSRLLDDPARTRAILAALREARPGRAFEPLHAALLDYAAKLTRDPAAIAESDVEVLRAAGADDGAILETNQVAAYFAYANRTVLGLGATTDGETLGLAPRASDRPGDWSHS
jgi:uncharacterized peroxidase-related enzyme